MTTEYLNRTGKRAVSKANVIFTMDSIRTYYMNLSHEDSVKIGNQAEHLFTRLVRSPAPPIHVCVIMRKQRSHQHQNIIDPRLWKQFKEKIRFPEYKRAYESRQK